MIVDKESTNLVAASRAGDIFHYRWAARRCLNLIKADSQLACVVIEGSTENEKEGEYGIDLSEYFESESQTRIIYYQLKHATSEKQKKLPFTLSLLRRTIEQFAARYKQHRKEDSQDGVSFTVISNRKIADSFKTNISLLAVGKSPSSVFKNTITTYTNLDGNQLADFCSRLNLEDSQGDYQAQKEVLKNEMALLQPGTIDSAQVSSIVSLVQEKVMPDSDRIIHKEEILRIFGVSSLGKLFPAQPSFEKIEDITVRQQYSDLISIIASSSHPVIITAEGGVGKSIFSQYLITNVPSGSITIAYDCFGAGDYRKRSKPRHRHRDALVQISNELAGLGLCERMLVKDTTLASDITRGFIHRIKHSITYLQGLNHGAKLFIVIDAADNAEMASNEVNDSCFAAELLREDIPDGCKLVLLCRPERLALLKAPSHTVQLSLCPFSQIETYENLLKRFPTASEAEALEFHRLTSGNPRVQMNAINLGHASVHGLLRSLGPLGSTVEEQIERQLDNAVKKIKDYLPGNYQVRITRICRGLACLPPNVPLEVLSKVADVSVEELRSFISEIGRPLWLRDESVQFRDEPTETWFRKTFSSTIDNLRSYIRLLETEATKLVYVAEVLPQLYHEAGLFEKLIDSALSEDLLPVNNPIDARNILVYRLQFALKAALKAEKYVDAIKIALRAGEEIAGDNRQQFLFQKHADLIPLLQSKYKVQNIAFKAFLRGDWEGSENAYTASLLSHVEEFHGEASSYLRSALNWLQLYFKDVKKVEDGKRPRRVEVSNADVLELAYAQLNIGGATKCIDFLNSLEPEENIFHVTKQLLARLLDCNRLSDVNQLLDLTKDNLYQHIAIVSVLQQDGRLVDSKYLKLSLQGFLDADIKVPIPFHQELLLFIESCISVKLDSSNILSVIDRHKLLSPSQELGHSYRKEQRDLILRVLVIRNMLSTQPPISTGDLLQQCFPAQAKRYVDDDRKMNDLMFFIEGLFPWYCIRLRVLVGSTADLEGEMIKLFNKDQGTFSATSQAEKQLRQEVASIISDTLIYSGRLESEIISRIYEQYLAQNTSFNIPGRLKLLRASHRLDHLSGIRASLEASTYELIKNSKQSDPGASAELYISLSRAVLASSKADAAVYFDNAIEAVSKFGDEAVERWNAVAALGSQITCNAASQKLAYRFIRCAELIGNYVDREKHWNRSGALVTCARMSSAIAISALSRWRDRGVGDFEYQLQALLEYLIVSQQITASVAWSMARFFYYPGKIKFLASCLSNENSSSVKADILNDAFKLSRKQGAEMVYWSKLQKLASEDNVIIEELDDIINGHDSHIFSKVTSDGIDLLNTNAPSALPAWGHMEDFNFTDLDSLQLLYDRHMEGINATGEHNGPRPIHLYLHLLTRIDADKVLGFVETLLDFVKIEYYEFHQVIKAIPSTWTNKVSFSKHWPAIVERLGTRYSADLIHPYTFEYFSQELDLNIELKSKLKEGIFQGLSEGQDLSNPAVLFGFTTLAADFINADNANLVTDFALSRFDKHIEDTFADGAWSNQLCVTNDVDNCIAGFLWSALGSPKADTRWRVCHAITSLCLFDCKSILDQLIDWMEKDEVGAYGSTDFPFYRLHARQYLLIALARSATDQTEHLYCYSPVFYNLAVGEPHIVIQKLSAFIALQIESGKPQTYNREQLSLLEQVGTSQLAPVNVNVNDYKDSYLHQEGKVDSKLDYTFGWDFERYWYEPLGEIFGLPGKQIQELCAQTIIEEWHLGSKNGYYQDPRAILWDRYRNEETYHSHGTYPEVDRWDFYLSYHSMLTVAGKLIQNMPINHNRFDWYQCSPWDHWISAHYLTRQDGRWLADLCGPLPLNRPCWLKDHESDMHQWRSTIEEDLFLNSILTKDETEDWLTLKAGWSERFQNRSESTNVSCALVSESTSEALQRALQSCTNHYDFKLPDYEEEGFEICYGNFCLTGIVSNESKSKGIDEFDPYAYDLGHPLFTLGQNYADELNLVPDKDGKAWTLRNGKTVVTCDNWRSLAQNYAKEPEQIGMRMRATTSLLKELCTIHNSHLIIEVIIKRDLGYKSRDEDYQRIEPTHKIFIFTENGLIKG